MEWLWWCVLISYFVVAGFAFFYFYRSRKLIGYHLGMNMAMISSGVIGLAAGVVLGALFPMHYTVVTIVTTLLAIFAGIVFGALVDYQTLITGVISGIMTGLMGPMIGMMADQPGLLILFGSVLLYVSFGLLCFSIRV